MANVRLIDANTLGRYISDWQMSLPGDNRHNWDAAAYDTLEDVLDAINEAPTIDPETLRPVVKIAWKKRVENCVSYKQIPASELLYNGEYAYTKTVKEFESDIPYCPECHTLIDCIGKARFCSFCGVKLEVTKHA